MRIAPRNPDMARVKQWPSPAVAGGRFVPTAKKAPPRDISARPRFLGGIAGTQARPLGVSAWMQLDAKKSRVQHAANSCF
jgi:hypothetical protein